MKILKIIIVLFIVFSITGISYYFFKTPKDGVYNYNEKRDRTFILDIFKEDWHWLVSEYSEGFSPEFMLENRTNVNDPSTYGRLTIKVYLEKGKPSGFVAYYKKTITSGYILFLDVSSKYRRKGYSEKLLEYAFKDMISKGFHKVSLVTRVSNAPAIGLYKKMGFDIIKQDDEFVDFEKRFK